MKLILNNGEVFTGNKIEIVRAMRGSSMFSDYKQLGEYIDSVVRNAKMFENLEFDVRGEDDMELAESFIGEIISHELGIIIEEEGK